MSSPLSLDKPLRIPSELAPSPPRIAKALHAFEEAVGGRESLVAELAQATLVDKEEQVLQLLADPENDSRPLADLLGYSGLSVAKFLRIFRDARGARGYLEALDRVWGKLPDVAADVMAKALPQTRTCWECNQSGFQRLADTTGKRRQNVGKLKKQEERVVCPRCHGEGRYAVEPSYDYQKLALAIGGLPRSTPQIQIDSSRTVNNQQNTQQNFIGSDTMRDFIAATTRVKYGPRPQVVEAEVSEVAEPTEPAEEEPA